MKTEDLARLIKVQLIRHGTLEQDTGRLMLTEAAAEGAAVGIAADLSARLSRPVVTINRQHILQAAAYAGYGTEIANLPNGVKMVVPVDAEGRDVFDQLNKVADFFVRYMLDNMPEATLREVRT